MKSTPHFKPTRHNIKSSQPNPLTRKTSWKSSPVICPICQHPQSGYHEIPFDFFRHMDFETIKTGGQIIACETCGQISNHFNPRETASVASLFTSEAYSRSNQTSQTAIDKLADNQIVSRCLLQARLIQKYLPASQPSILDIGCFDGMLLRHLRQCLPASAILHGYDINPWLANRFPTDLDLRFWCGSLAEVQGPFNLISLPYSLMYMDNLNVFFTQINRLLTPDGQLYIQVPNIIHNICTLLMGDQYGYYTPDSLTSLLNYFNFDVQFIPTDWAPRDIICLARYRHKNTLDAKPTLPDISILLSQLYSLAINLIRFQSLQPLWILGTTTNAAFSDSILDHAITGFVDENPNRIQTLLRAKPVRHPQSLQPDDTILIPYGPTSQTIANRLQARYPGHYIPVDWE